MLAATALAPARLVPDRQRLSGSIVSATWRLYVTRTGSSPAARHSSYSTILVTGLESWARPETEPEAEREKESRRWFRGFDQGRELGRESPGKRVVVVGDCESDIYELLKRQSEQREEGGLVMRANASRQRKVQVWDEDLGPLIRTLESQPDCEEPVQTGRKIVIDSQGGKRARTRRTATTELRIGKVQLQPPQKRAQDGPETAWLVRVLETSTPAAAEGGRAGELPGVRRDHGSAGVQPGALRAGHARDAGRRNGVRCRATSCCGAPTCKCRAWCATGKRRADPSGFPAAAKGSLVKGLQVPREASRPGTSSARSA